MERLLDEIIARRPKLSKGQKKIADYILNSYEQAAFMTANRLGETVGVSESTVVRFAAVMGREGYPELQSELQELIRNKLTTVQRAQMTSGMKLREVIHSVMTKDIADIRTTMEMVDYQQYETAIDYLLNARRIYVLGLRSAMPMAQFLSYYLDYVCDGVMFINGAVQDLRERMVRLNEQDVLIGISFPRYSARTVDALRYARSRGAKVIALTDRLDSPAGRIADCSLCAKSDMASFADSFVAPLSLINALIVALSQCKRQQVSAYFAQMESIWDEYQVYLGKDRGTNE